MRRFASSAAAPAVLLLLSAGIASAHGIAGKRFFPATIQSDDPFVAEELSLPTVSRTKPSDDPSVKETDISTEYSKRITPNFGISLGATYVHLDQASPRNPYGFQNFEVTPKYQFFESDAHEAVASAGLSVELGGTGARRIGAESVTGYRPTLYFGKGAGDLPERWNWARPFAVTGVFGYGITSRKQTTSTDIDPDTGLVSLNVDHHSNQLVYGGAIEYSMRYLQSEIRDLGLGDFVNALTPLVEFAFTTPVTDRYGEKTRGTVNPGILWSGQSYQIGFEAVIPVTRDTGKAVGFVAQLHFYLDDIFPNSIGKPLFGGTK
ncbi:MAG: hypothetical protein JWL84_4424 [Rhodospirillales bacterium]|nr:hypothetical protein [Rhodospirillales bacterium]